MLANTGDTGGNWYDKLGLGTTLGLVTGKVNQELKERLNLGDQDSASALAAAPASHDAMGRPLSSGAGRLVVIGAALLAIVLAVAYARTR